MNRNPHFLTTLCLLSLFWERLSWRRERRTVSGEKSWTKRSPTDSLISCFEVIKTNTRWTRSPIPPATLAIDQKISLMNKLSDLSPRSPCQATLRYGVDATLLPSASRRLEIFDNQSQFQFNVSVTWYLSPILAPLSLLLLHSSLKAGCLYRIPQRHVCFIRAFGNYIFFCF